MNVPDITIVLNLHREGVLASYTLRSLSDTALHAAAGGLSVELVAVLDSPDATTRAVLRDLDGTAFVRVEILEVAHRSLGPSRNAGIDAARGTYVVIADGDDLYSFNYLVAMHATAAAGDRVIALPEYNVWFGADDLVQQGLPLARSGRFRLAGSHTFQSCIIAPTSLLRDLRYRDCAGSRVYAYEDYDLNCRAVAAGADLGIATDAVLFYRKHASSIMAAIGDATRRIVPPNALFDPVAFAAADGDAVIDDPETLRPGVMAYRRSHRLAELVAHASAIEPQIELARIRDAPIYTTAHFERGFGATFHTLCRRLGAERFDDVLVVSSLASCPPSLLRIADTPSRRCLVVEMARGAAANGPATRAQVVALDAYEPALPARRRPEMVVRLVHAFAARACLHIVLGEEVDAFLGAFAEALECNNVVVYAMRGGGGLAPDRAWTIEGDAFAAIDLVVSDDPDILDTLVSRMPICARKVLLLDEPRAAQEAGRWLAAAYDRLEPRAKESRWTT